MAVRSDTHAALWFDRFPRDLEETGIVASHLGGALETLRSSLGYRAFFDRYQAGLTSLPPVTLTAVATARGRLAIGLGRESVLENSIALHHTYGVPYLPGSSLKGLASSFARKEIEDPAWQRDGAAHETVFGKLEDSGYVIFHDALWIPPPLSEGSPEALLPLSLDVMTVHHKDYYGGGASVSVPPAEWDEPVPVGFLTATGSYRLAVTGPKAWAEAALDLLTHALDRLGVGAKTAAGYGRMDVEWEPRRVTKPAAATKSEKDGEVTESVVLPERISVRAQLKGMGRGKEAVDIPKILAGREGEELRTAAREIIEILTPKELKKSKNKQWVQDLLAAAGE